ncbi:sulfotransferase [Sporichthya brevicatena]
MERPVLVMGCPRSGTTLMRLMLLSHPRIAVPPETRFVLRSYYERAKFGDLTQEANRRKLAEFITGKQGQFERLGIDRKQTIEAIVAAPPTIGSALSATFEQYAARFDKPRWGDKFPTYIEHVDDLLRLYPDAQLVNMVRDGRDAAASLTRQRWSKRDTPEAIAQWNRAIDYGRRAAKRVPPGQWMEIRYEALVSDPEPVLKELCNFIGEDFAPEMLTPHEVGSDATVDGRPLAGKLAGEVTTSSIGRWRERFEPWEAELMNAMSGRRLRSLGYEVPKGARPSPKAVARTIQADLDHRARRIRRQQKDLLQRRQEAKAGISVAAVPR